MHLLAVALLLAALLPAAAAPAQTPLPPGVAGVELIPGWRRADGRHVAAVELRLEPGWHTYWRVPGEAGIPPEFDWSRSKNLADVGYRWPRPEPIESYGTVSIGYPGKLVLPVVLIPERAGEDIAADLDLFFGVCKQICVPARARVEALLPSSGPAQGRERIDAALADRAQSPAEAGVARVTCGVSPDSDGLELTARVTFQEAPGPGQVAIVESGRPGDWLGAPESRTEGRTVVARARLEGRGKSVLERSALRLTVLDARRAVDIRGCEPPG